MSVCYILKQNFLCLTFIKSWTRNARVHVHPHTRTIAVQRVHSTSSYRDKTLSILHYRAPVTFMKYFAFQSHDAEFHNGHIISLHWLIGQLKCTQTHKDIQDTEGNDDLFSVPSSTGERPLSVLAWQCTGATTELLSTALRECVCQSVCACEAKQRRVTL